jgi:hypothetical protein
MLLDIKKAHLYAPIDGDVYTDLSPERATPGKCAKLIFTLYGMRVAARNWENEYSNAMLALGFTMGRANKSTFYHECRSLRVVVHGDDFVVTGREPELRWLEQGLRAKYPLKMRGILGPEAGDSKEGVILNRKVYFRENGIVEFEADSDHVPKILQGAGMEGCNTTVVPSSKEETTTCEEELDWRRARTYRSIVARANYLSQDRPDIRFTVKELCRRMARPTSSDWSRAKKLCRYLAGCPRMLQGPVAGNDEQIEVYVDADWGGCPKSRMSTSRGAVIAFGMCVKTWAATQGTVARSSEKQSCTRQRRG